MMAFGFMQYVRFLKIKELLDALCSPHPLECGLASPESSRFNGKEWYATTVNLTPTTLFLPLYVIRSVSHMHRK